ncbi:MAG: thiaminase II [Streptosporangiaceae bacterium]
MSDSLSDELWHGISGIYEAILAHPFITGLTDGSLAESAFAFYVVQDALYLTHFAATLAGLGLRAPDAAQTEMFARHAAGVVSVERTLHESLLADLGIDPEAARTADLAPASLGYTSFLRAAVTCGGYAEGVGAVLPCYLIYWKVGTELLRRGSPEPRYQRWIGTYGGDEYAAAAGEMVATADRIGRGLSAAERSRVHRNFRTASRYEWLFWDMGYRQEGWPV